MSVFTAQADALFNNDTLAVDATYNGATPVRIFLTEGVDLSGIGNLEMAEYSTVIDVRKSDVPAPARGDTFLVGSTTYTVRGLLANDGIVAKLAVSS